MMKFNKLSVTFGKRRILEDISFALQPHKMTAVLGRNGSGKSTLISCITGNTPYTGEILLGDRNIALMTARERAQQIAVLPQILPKVSFTVYELVAMGRNPYLDMGKRLSAVDREQIKRAVEWAGLQGMEEKRADTLSGGERQKAYLAMILAQNTRIVILDEPTTYLDMISEADFEELLVTLKTKYKKTVMVVMHDLTRAVEISDNIVIIGEGRTLFTGTAKECTDSGMIEKTFDVKRSSYRKEDRECVLYYK